MTEPVIIAPFDPGWPARFEEGSTAVPGLDAKPVIDILVGIHDLERARGREAYTEAKAPFVRAVLGGAVRTRRPR